MKKKLLLVISVLFMFPVIANADIRFPKYINGNTKLEGLDTLDNGDVVYYQWVKYKEADLKKQKDLEEENINLGNDVIELENTYGENNTTLESYRATMRNNDSQLKILGDRNKDYDSQIENYSKNTVTTCDGYKSINYSTLTIDSISTELKDLKKQKNDKETEMNAINCDSLSGTQKQSCLTNKGNIQIVVQCYSNLYSAINNYGNLLNSKKITMDNIASFTSSNEDCNKQITKIEDINSTINKQINEKNDKISANKKTIKELENNPDDSKWVRVGYNNEISSSNLNDNSILYIKVVKSDGSSSVESTNYNYDASTGKYKNCCIFEDNTGKKQIKLDKITLSINSTFDLASLLEDTSIIYSSNNAEVATISSNGLITGLKAGTAIITAEGTGKIYTIDVEVKGSKIEDSTGNSSIIYNGDALDEGTQENYNKINENDNLYKEIEKKVTGAKRFEVIEITLTKDGQNVQPKSKVTVEIKIPSGYNPDNILVYYVEEDGTLTLVNHIVVGDKVQIDTDKVGKFVIVEKEDQNKNESSNNTTENPKTGTIISISVIIVGIIVATGIYFYTKKKNKLFRL